MEIIQISVWILLLAVVSAQDNSGGCTDEAGNKYKNGTGFTAADGCNSCFCSNGAIGCTLMACVPQEVCVHNGIEYKEGENYMDDCNSCVCGMNGKGRCTRKGCPPKVCESNGKMYGAGESFMDAGGCNRCGCGQNGVAFCTMKRCFK